LERSYALPDEPLLGFVEIPAGDFVMGSDPEQDEWAFPDEEPVHTLHLPRYYLARYPVTKAQFRVFVAEREYRPSDPNCLLGPPDHPVTRLTWNDAMAYCAWLGERILDLKRLPPDLAQVLRQDGWRLTLPSEAEWEKGARGQDGRIFPWGNPAVGGRANSQEADLNKTTPVGSFPAGASPYGLLDMSGNAWEWTRSLWGMNPEAPYYRYPYDFGDGRENLEASEKVCRVFRGGGYLNGLRYLRCASRGGGDPTERDRDIGFRLAITPPGEPSE
jgi:formylglycine-generating enzyme required for sulfatase activity